MRIILPTIILQFLVYSFFYGQGTTCATADPFCTGTTYTFPNNLGTTAPAGNNYDCLWSQPNPAWYYISLASGDDTKLIF